MWKSDGPIKPDPYLTTYDWAKSLSAGAEDAVSGSTESN